MQQRSNTLSINTNGRQLVDITGKVNTWVHQCGINSGLLTLYIQHTSASLLINENYDPDVKTDIERFFARLIPDGDPLFEHIIEGPDDMPAHIRTALTNVSLTIPLINGKLALGQWQGIFVYEHRLDPHLRRVVLHLQGE